MIKNLEQEPLIYLDNAATTWPKSKELLAKMTEIYCCLGVSPGRGSYDRAMIAEEFIADTRKKVARFFYAPDAERIVFTANATDAVNIAFTGLLKEGDHVITTMLEHNSVLRPLTHLQQRHGITFSCIPFNEQGVVETNVLETLLQKEQTALVVINHASNVLGTVQPVSEIGKVCAKYGVPLMLDASQSAGQVPVSMAETRAALIAFTGHKSLYAPAGIGGLVIAPEVDIQPSRVGGTGTESKYLFQPQDFPERLEAGTHNLLGIIGLSLALDELTEKNLYKWHKQEMSLAKMLYENLAGLPGIHLYGGDMESPHTALFSMIIDGKEPEDIGAILDGDFDIATRTGLHCAPLVHKSLGTQKKGAVRFSFGRYNSKDDVDAVIHAIKQIIRV